MDFSKWLGGPLGNADSEEKKAVQAAFRDELIATERLRFGLMAAFFGAALLFYFSFWLVFPQDYDRVFGTGVPIWMILGFFAGAVVYELWVRGVIIRRIQAGTWFSGALRYLNTAEEMSISTLVIILLMFVFDPGEAILTPAYGAYFVFLAVVTLRLDWRLCLFAGLVGALEYSAVAAYALNQSELLHNNGMRLLGEPLPHLAKALMILVAGSGSAIVTWRFREFLERALSAVVQRSEILQIFGQHVSPEVVNKLLDQSGAGQESELRDVCVMFLDIRDFTTYSETHSPQEVVQFLNQIFDYMIDIVNTHNGIINKFLGDGFMAVFGAPISNSDDCRNAVQAAIDLVAETERRIAAGQIPGLRVGIGLHAGRAVTGSVGSTRRKEYTIIGDVVNTASRIEQLNKRFSSQILVSQTVWDRLSSNTPDVVAVHSDVILKGKSKTLTIHQLV